MVFQPPPSRFRGDNQNCRFSCKQHRHSFLLKEPAEGSACPGLRRHTHTLSVSPPRLTHTHTHTHLTGRSSALKTPYGVNYPSLRGPSVPLSSVFDFVTDPICLFLLSRGKRAINVKNTSAGDDASL